MKTSFSQARLLIVDDDPVLRNMAAKTLRHAGFEVSEVENGEDAVALFAARPYALLLLDVLMPGIDGYEVCRRIRAMKDGARVPILILTGLNDTESIEFAYGQGATDFITKPINWNLLSHRVRYALRAGSATEDMRRGRESLARAQSLAGMGNWAMAADGAVECSAELVRLFSIPADAANHISAQGFLARVAAPDRARVSSARAQLLNAGTPYQLEFEIEGVNGKRRTVFEQAVAVVNDHGRPTDIEGITQDITERVQAQERIQQLANYDDVTGLPNAQFFAALAGQPLEQARRDRTNCALLHVDLDRFKDVNNAFGRSQGDIVLKTMAERLRSWIRGSDLASSGEATAGSGVVARVGANAFTLLITDLPGQSQVTVVAQRLLKAIAAPIIVDSQALVLTASIGIAFFPGDARDLLGLARCAEQAEHAAKAAGPAQYRFFNEQMNEHAASRLSLETDLRSAITGNELRLHFQPKVDAATGTIVGAEALVRWRHPKRGLLGPIEFIPVAEETGLILPLTDWVLESACGRLREWADAGLRSIPLSVNLAASSLMGTTLVDTLDDLMRRFQLKPASLMLEMTETMLMSDVESSVQLLQFLRSKGYGLSLDDFGTGYSSLSYLKRFTMDELKVDRAFVTHAANGGRDGALAAAIIALGRELGLQVVAEGVETSAQSSFLLDRGCNLQQGYLFSKAVAAEPFEALLREGVILLSDTAAAASRDLAQLQA